MIFLAVMVMVVAVAVFGNDLRHVGGGRVNDFADVCELSLYVTIPVTGLALVMYLHG